MSDIKIYDNFIDKTVFEEMKKQVLNINWQYGDKIANDLNNSPNCEEKYDWQMAHVFYKHPFEMSDNFSIINPIVQIIQPAIMYRAKLNLNPCTDKIVEHGYHQDYQPESVGKIFTSAIFYLNTNNGYTKFEDGTIISSIENRLVTFPSTMLHTGTSCTDTKYRLVLNLVYVNGSYFA